MRRFAICVNAGYSIEISLKVLCHIHNGQFHATHNLRQLHDALPDSVQIRLTETFYGYVTKYGMKISYLGGPITLTPGEPVSLGPIHHSFGGWMEEFDRVGMASKRYPENSPDLYPPNHVHQAILCSMTSVAVMDYFVNRL